MPFVLAFTLYLVLGIVLATMPMPPVLAFACNLADTSRGYVPFLVISFILNVKCAILMLGEDLSFEPLVPFLEVRLHSGTYFE